MQATDCQVEGKLNLLLVIEVRLYREGLVGLLEKQPNLAVLDSAADRMNAVIKAKALQPDVVLIDTGFPDSLAMIRELREVAPLSRVVGLGINETEAAIISYAEAGVSGYVTRDGSFENLLASIRASAENELHCSPRVAAVLLRQVAKVSSGIRLHLGRLTSREWQIIELVEQGLSNKEIAKRLTISISTTKNHLHHILNKVGVRSRNEAASRLRHLLIGSSTQVLPQV